MKEVTIETVRKQQEIENEKFNLIINSLDSLEYRTINSIIKRVQDRLSSKLRNTVIDLTE